jgi:Cu-processing system permease protein
MSAARTVFVYQLRDLVRSKWLIAYALFFFIAAEGLLRYGGSDAKALLSLSSLVLLVVPLITVVYGTVYLYNTREFTELLLAQPVRRAQLYAGLYLGVTAALSASVVLGVAVPFLMHGGLGEPALRGAFVTLLFTAGALTCVFTALAILIATRTEDRLRGLGAAIAVWLALALLYDGVVLIGVATFSDYPLERVVLIAMFFNPVDLARVLLLMQFDNAALMGYTGAVFERFFSGAGMFAAGSALLAWIAIPALLGARAFRQKDF